MTAIQRLAKQLGDKPDDPKAREDLYRALERSRPTPPRPQTHIFIHTNPITGQVSADVARAMNEACAQRRPSRSRAFPSEEEHRRLFERAKDLAMLEDEDP